MGVHGLWKLIESSGKPVPLETLENKVLAVDVSIWLHQAIKGFQDHKGAALPNAHLLGIYHRVCKLLYFRIKPIFVFDGGVPALKKQTIAKRNQYKSKNASEVDRLQRQLINTLLKHTAISKVLSEKTKASLPLPKKSGGRYDNLYDPPSSEFDSTLSSSDDDVEESLETVTTDSSPTKQWDLHTIDTTSHYFKTLPIEMKHEILTDLKETRKQNSWGKLHQLPKQSDDFSTYQMKRLLKRQEVQSALDEVSKEMGGMSLSLAELESLLKDQGIKTTNDVGKKIASDSSTRYLYIKDIQKEIKMKEQEEKNAETNIDDSDELKRAIQLSLEETPSTSTNEKVELSKKTIADLEEEEELRKAIQLSLEDAPSSNSPESNLSHLESLSDTDFESDEADGLNEQVLKNEKSFERKVSSAQSYMLEYSGLTPAEIKKILEEKNEPLTKRVSKHLKLKTLNANSVKKLEDQNILTQLETISIKKSRNEVLQSENISKKSQPAIKEVDEEILKKCEETNKIDVLKPEVKKLPNNIKEIANDESEVGIISDSGDSTDEEVNVESPKALEIFVDPQKMEEDDLFNDIFDTKIFDNDEKIKDNKEELIIDPLIKPKLPLSNEPINIIDYKDDIKKDCPIENFSQARSEEIIQNKDIIKIDKEVVNEENIKSDTSVREKNINEPSTSKLTVPEMMEIKDNLQHEKIDLLKEKAYKERLANNITDQMYQEAQELLELFGVPYVIAPMEAEAQCAFLDEIELTNGTITDDSDIWLFGGRTVYKNFFNQSKYVMEFKSENIEHHFKLSRQQMILLALLVGSDYTTGLQGVGPVTALEILASFPPTQSQEFTLSNNQLLSGLKEFKSWYLKGKTSGLGRSALKNKLKNVSFSDYFPNSQVVEAYLDPKIDPSKEPFSWSKPDINGLTVFAKEKFGWTMKKTEEILNPVIKKLEENRTQKSIKNYFETQFKVDAIDIDGKVSKRVKSAIDKFGKSSEELIAEEMAELDKAKRKAVEKKSTNGAKSKKRKKVDEKNDDHSVDLVTITPAQSNDNLVQMTNKDDDMPKTSNRSKKKKDADEDKKHVKAATSKVPKQKKKSSKYKEKVTLQEMEELKDYENLALELKARRKRQNELKSIKIEDKVAKKAKITPLLSAPLIDVPKELEDDEEIKLLAATTSKSAKCIERINAETSKMLEQKPFRKKVVPATNLHATDVIHQRLRDRSNVLRNRIKAIEVFRKSKKGPGYVSKRNKTVVVPKEDAELSEASD